MTDKKSIVDGMKDWVNKTPGQVGDQPTEQMLAQISNGRFVVVMLTDKGHAYHLDNINMHGAKLTRYEDARTFVNKLMDSLGTEDGPNWTEAEKE